MKMKFHRVKRRREYRAYLDGYEDGHHDGRFEALVELGIRYYETTDAEREHIELLLMIEDERADHDLELVPEWTLS